MMEYWNGENRRSGLLTCVVPGGIFKKNEKYPYFISGGYYYLVLLPIDYPSQIQFLRLDCFDNGTFKVNGMGENEELASFI